MEKWHRRLLIQGTLCSFTLVALFCGAAQGQEPSAKRPAHPRPVASPVTTPVVVPGNDKIVLLLRTTMLTFNDALQTGNFTVLRDKAAPAFREANSSARLSSTFRDLLQSNTDLSIVAVVAPRLEAPPLLDPKTSMLHLKGHFSGYGGARLNFEVVYQPIGGHWRLFALTVQGVAAAPAAAATTPGQDLISEPKGKE